MKYLLFFLLTGTTAFAQENFKKQKSESVEDFVARIWPEIKPEYIAAGSWGDTKGGDKIVVFYRDSTDDKKAFVLQPVSKKKFQRIEPDHTFGLGVYPYTSEIVVVTYHDVNDDGVKELIIMENGSVRCPVELEEYNEETGETETIATWATCDVCGYTVLEQDLKTYSVKAIGSYESTEWDCNSDTIQNIMEEK